MTYKIAGMYQDSSLPSDDRWGRGGNPVTLSIKIIARRAIPHPSGQKGLSNPRTLRTLGAKGPVNLPPFEPSEPSEPGPQSGP